MTTFQAEHRRLLTIKELAEKLSVPIQTIYYWVSRNEIPFIKVGRHDRFVLEDVIACFKEKTKIKNSSKRPWSLI